MPSYALLSAAAKDEEEGDKKLAVKTPVTGPCRGYFLVFLSVFTSLVFGVNIGWQLSAHYIAKEQYLSQSSGLLSGCMKPSAFHVWNFTLAYRLTHPCRSRWSQDDF